MENRNSMKPLAIVDIFAGPGGLNEGFSNVCEPLGHRSFTSVLAAEMDTNAHETLTLRSFFRTASTEGVSGSYYRYIRGEQSLKFDSKNKDLFVEAQQKSLRVTLGTPDGNNLFDLKLSQVLKDQTHWVLLGGPPCQAYSTARRWTFRTEGGFDLSGDHRAHLYKEYLRIIQKFGPSVFVMENVKGILSSKYFTAIRDDLQQVEFEGFGYNIYSVVQPENDTADPREFLVKAEKYGVPQKRHRVVLLGVRKDIKVVPRKLVPSQVMVSVFDALSDLPKLRSGISKGLNTDEAWIDVVGRYVEQLSEAHGFGVTAIEKLPQSSTSYLSKADKSRYFDWVNDANLKSLPNHTTRGHMQDDLARYLFAALFGKKHGYSPKSEDFPESLAPKHRSWNTGKFNDRFRVQVAHEPATTIVSHISKDGHSFIHYDPAQARSLTVREAARLQSFPDNYFFCGPRTEQFKQVGNAVPPLLAYQIGEIVAELFRDV
jgi:DNA (cytosine-5)-methyltransferase 1